VKETVAFKISGDTEPLLSEIELRHGDLTTLADLLDIRPTTIYRWRRDGVPAQRAKSVHRAIEALRSGEYTLRRNHEEEIQNLLKRVAILEKKVASMQSAMKRAGAA
jgi:hypothetical protein